MGISKFTEINVLERLSLESNKDGFGLDIVKTIVKYEINIRYIIILMLFSVLFFLGFLIIFRDSLSWPSILFQNMVMAFLGFVGAGAALSRSSPPRPDDENGQGVANKNSI